MVTLKIIDLTIKDIIDIIKQLKYRREISKILKNECKEYERLINEYSNNPTKILDQKFFKELEDALIMCIRSLKNIINEPVNKLWINSLNDKQKVVIDILNRYYIISNNYVIIDLNGLCSSIPIREIMNESIESINNKILNEQLFSILSSDESINTIISMIDKLLIPEYRFEKIKFKRLNEDTLDYLTRLYRYIIEKIPEDIEDLYIRKSIKKLLKKKGIKKNVDKKVDEYIEKINKELLRIKEILLSEEHTNKIKYNFQVLTKDDY